jgi:glycosyltransferase involved in cell wall biosynthesis
MTSPAVSVVIPTFGRPALACAAARSALAQALDAPFEVIVVDDGGQDGTREALEALGDARLRYLWIEHAGPAAARNAGVKAAEAPLIAFLDSDTVAQPGWLQAGFQRLREETGLFGVEGRVERDAQYPPTPFTEAVENLNGGRWLTCNLFVRKDGFAALGGFDERFSEPCREDSEFAFRARAAGQQLAFVPAALVRHPAREVTPGRQYHHAREGRFEALIERQHPQAYRQSFKWLDGRQAPAYYWAHYAALFLLPFSLKLSAAVLGLGVIAVLYAWCRKRNVRPLDPLRLLVPALLAPYLRLFWVAWGYERYPGAPDGRGGRDGRPSGPPLHGNDWVRVGAVVLVLIAYALTRTFFYLQPLIDEEGLFAYMLAHAPAGPAYGLIARLGGQDLREPLLHPAGLYEIYGRLGQLLRLIGVHAVTDISARLAQSCFEGFLWAVLALHYGRARGGSAVLLGLLALLALSSPLGMSASIYLQTDTSTGLLMAGLLVFAVMESATLLGPALALLALGALGKQEWSIAAALGLAMAELWQDRSGRLKRAAFLGGALVLGNYFSVAYDPLNYLGGLGVMSRLSVGHHALVSGQAQAWSGFWRSRQPFVLSVFLLLVPATLLAWRAPAERRATERTACALAWAFFLPFLASTWNDSPRYFAPAWAAALFCLAGQLFRRSPGRWALLATAILALGVSSLQTRYLTAVSRQQLSLTEFPLAPVSGIQQLDQVQDSYARGDCVRRLSAANTWNRPVDFVLWSADYQQSVALAAARGRSLCLPPAQR